MAPPRGATIHPTNPNWYQGHCHICVITFSSSFVRGYCHNCHDRIYKRSRKHCITWDEALQRDTGGRGRRGGGAAGLGSAHGAFYVGGVSNEDSASVGEGELQDLAGRLLLLDKEDLVWVVQMVLVNQDADNWMKYLNVVGEFNTDLYTFSREMVVMLRAAT